MDYIYSYPRMLVTVDSLVFLRDNSTTNKILLIQRKNSPFKGMYALPGGFVDMDETLKDAAIRELHEETGLKGIELEFLNVFDEPNRDPRDRNICAAFYGFTTAENSAIYASDDAENATWVDIEQLPKLAFDHNEIVNLARKKLSI